MEFREIVIEKKHINYNIRFKIAIKACFMYFLICNIGYLLITANNGIQEGEFMALFLIDVIFMILYYVEVQGKTMFFLTKIEKQGNEIILEYYKKDVLFKKRLNIDKLTFKESAAGVGFRGNKLVVKYNNEILLQQHVAFSWTYRNIVNVCNRIKYLK